MIVTLADEFKKSSKTPFIVFEGVNGAGKSSIIELLKSYLTQKNIPCLFTREPGASESSFCVKIRSLLLESDIKRSKLAELFLFCADRAEHIETVIKPALEQKKIVVSDRFVYSTTAFQGYGRDLPLEIISKTNSLVLQDLVPSVVFLLDIDPAEGLKRTTKRNNTDTKDNFEDLDLEFHNKVRQGFLKIAQEEKDVPFVVIDATKSKEEIFKIVKKIVDSLIH